MLAPRWRKVLADIVGNRSRTLLVVASIFIGVFNVGVVVAVAVMIPADLRASYLSANPPHAQIRSEPFSPALLPMIRRVEEVAAAEGRRTVSLNVRTASGQWRSLRLMAIPDFAEMRVGRLQRERGAWPPADRQILIERASLPFLGAELGDSLAVRLADGAIRSMPLVGVVFDDQAGPGSAVELQGYITFETLAWLREPANLNRLYITVAEDADNRAHIEEVADRVADRIRRSGRQVTLIFVPRPGERPGSAEIIGVVQIIALLGLLSVCLSGFLVFNMLAALLAQHVRQIGMMKAIGARRGQIVGMYVVFILLIGLCALIPALPLASAAAYAIAEWLGQRFNYNTLGFRLVPQAAALQVIMGAVVALLAALPAILNGTRISVRAAIDQQGLGQGKFGQGLLDRLISHVRGLSRPLLISLRNLLRRRLRLALTLVTLTLGGAIFIGVFNMRLSLVLFLNEFGNYFLSDVNLNFERVYHIDEVTQEALTVPGVAHVEAWAVVAGDLLGADGEAFNTVTLFGPPAESALVTPVLVAGRWLLPGDENAIAVNNAFLRVVPDLQVGDAIRLHLLGKETTWRVVGIFQFVGSQQLLAYANYEYVARVLGAPNRASQFRIVGHAHSPADQRALAARLVDHFRGRGFQVASTQTGRSLADANAAIVTTIVAFFLLIAALIGLVGAIGLMGTLSMNVLERTREIGVLRAIGASNRAILQIVLVEGLLIGCLSWMAAALLALPLSRLMTELLSQALFQTPARFNLTPNGFGVWLALVLILSALAALVPARNAARITVRDALAYE